MASMRTSEETLTLDMRVPGKTECRIWAAAVAALWTAACFLPSVAICGRDGTGPENWFANDTIVLFGWLGPLIGMFGWYANLTLVIGLTLLLLGRMPGLWLAAADLLLTLSAFVPDRLWQHEGWSEPICAYGAGWWTWTAANLVFAAAALRGWRRSR